MVMRYDRAPFKATRTAEGYIVDSPVLTRTGVFTYRDGAGKERREYRPPEEVFAADSLASLRGKPITDGHPGKVDAKNARKHMIGTAMSEGRQDGDNMVGDIQIVDVAPVEAGKRELSLGYELLLDETPGTAPNGERYDAVQRHIRINHLAVVHLGRAGNARLNLDAADAVTITEEEHDMNMVKVRLDSGIAYDAPPEVANAYEKLRADAAAAKVDHDAAVAKLNGDLEREKARADAAEADKAKAEGAIVQARADAAKAARARIELETTAKAHGVEIKQDAKDLDIQVDVIKKIRGDSFDATGRAPEYIAAMYDIAISEAGRRQDAASQQRQAVTGKPDQRQDGGDNQPKSARGAREAMIQQQRNPGSK